jgi:vacuolar-type H+-ATPase subunit H
MALDRQSIEKRDFPIGRRGYEPEAVDEHLSRLAAEIEDLQRSAQRRSGASLASAASDQVRAIVEAAEQSAAAIEKDAESEAARIRAEADRSAQKTEQDAVERSREHVSKVGEQASLMLQRVDAMEAELTALVESLRTGANRLNADLSLLESNMDDLYRSAGGTRGGQPAQAVAAEREIPAPAAPPVPAVQETPAPAPAAAAPVEEDDFGDEEPPAAAAPPAPAPAAPEPAAPAAAAPAGAAPGGPEDGGDIEGARLIALNMALNGQSRDETDRYLAENFDLTDRQALLDEVYESVGG